MRTLSLLLLLILGLAADAAQANCSRPIRVPVSNVGTSVIVEGAKVGGAYPELLRKLAPQGCSFAFEPMPRARAELLFERGETDMLVPATRSDRRDRLGEFVPLVATRVTAVGLKGTRPPVGSLDEILQTPALRVVLVRGFDFGARYRDMVEQLRRQNRLVLEADPPGVAKALRAGMADLTVLTPSILYGAVQHDERIRPLLEQLRIEPLADMPWSEAGFYLSHQSLGDADRQRLRELFEAQLKSGAVWQALLDHYPPGSLDGAMRPR